jgi:polysaccharide export outer membrane protein
MKSRWSACLGMLMALMCLAPAAARAQEYLIGAGDVLVISVWMHPELERRVTVDANGNVIFPPLGEIKASGLTPKQLGERLGDRLSSYLRQTATVTVAVAEFLSRSVMVSGAVVHPGRLGFEKMPPLLDVIQQAGGPQPNADLTRVQIVRRENGQLRTQLVNVSQAMMEGNESSLPQLQVGDVIVIPAGTAGVSMTADAAGVLGEITRPGLYPVGEGQDLWLVLSQAGGPTPRTNLSDIKVLTRREGGEATAVTVDLVETLSKGNRAPFVVHPGDIVFLNPKGSLWTAFLQLVNVAVDLAGLIAIIQVLQQ